MQKIQRMIIALAVLTLVSALALGEEKEETAADEETLNTICPVMEEEVDPEFFTMYKGKKVLLCCEECIEEFDADPESFIEFLPQFAVAAGETPEEAPPAPVKKSPKEKHPFGVLHMIFLHFPIALSGIASVAALLGLVFRGPFFRNAATFCIVFAAIFAVPSYFTGEEAHEAKGRTSESLHERIEDHEDWGTISMYTLIGVALLNLVSRMKSGSKALRWASFFTILGAAGVLSYTGFLGGEVAWGEGHLKYLIDQLPF